MKQDVSERFWQKVLKRGPDECWPYKGIEENRYGSFWMNGRTVGAHVAVLILQGIDMKKGDQGNHTCDFKPCCNPKHIYKGDQKQNQQDAVRRGRRRSNPRRGERSPFAKLTEAQVFAIHAHYLAGGWTHRSLAMKYGVSHVAIRYILHGEQWRHVYDQLYAPVTKRQRFRRLASR